MTFNAIYKYPIGWERVECVTAIDMPSGAQILTAKLNGGKVCIWALLNTDNKVETRRFIITSTGRGLPAELEQGKGKFIATVQDGYVFHVFELI